MEGFYDIIPKRLIAIFNEQELELLISGLPNIDIEDLKANTEYHKYQANSIQVIILKWILPCMNNWLNASYNFRFNGSGALSVALIKPIERNSCSLWLEPRRCRYKVLLRWKAWMECKSSKFIVTTVQRIVYRPHILGKIFFNLFSAF